MTKLEKLQAKATKLAAEFAKVGKRELATIIALTGTIPDDLESLMKIQYSLNGSSRLFHDLQMSIMFKAKKLCDHPRSKVQYHPDPSGNNDSHYHCSKCDGDFSRDPSE